MLHPRSVLSNAGRSSGTYGDRSAAVTSPPRAGHVRGDLLGQLAGVEVGPAPARHVGEGSASSGDRSVVPAGCGTPSSLWKARVCSSQPKIESCTRAR